MTSQPNPPPAVADKPRGVESYTDTYRVIAEWIRFADAKAGMTLTVNGILLAVVVPTLKTFLGEKAAHPFPWWVYVGVSLFLAWLLFLVLSAVYAFLCVLPIRGTGRSLAFKHTPHFHPAAVSQTYPLADVDRFISDCEQTGAEGFKRQVMTAILIDAHLSSSKYGHVTQAIRFLGVSIVFGFLYLLAIQF